MHANISYCRKVFPLTFSRIYSNMKWKKYWAPRRLEKNKYRVEDFREIIVNGAVYLVSFSQWPDCRNTRLWHTHARKDRNKSVLLCSRRENVVSSRPKKITGNQSSWVLRSRPFSWCFSVRQREATLNSAVPRIHRECAGTLRHAMSAKEAVSTLGILSLGRREV